MELTLMVVKIKSKPVLHRKRGAVNGAVLEEVTTLRCLSRLCSAILALYPYAD
jgi:hypothetical protein